MCACMLAGGFIKPMHFLINVFVEALYEKKQSMMVNEIETAKLQAQVKELEATSVEKDNLIAKYETTLEEREGVVRSYYKIV